MDDVVLEAVGVEGGEGGGGCRQLRWSKEVEGGKAKVTLDFRFSLAEG